MNESLMYLASEAINLGNTYSVEELEIMRFETLNEAKTDKVIKFIEFFWNTAMNIAQEQAI